MDWACGRRSPTQSLCAGTLGRVMPFPGRAGPRAVGRCWPVIGSSQGGSTTPFARPATRADDAHKPSLSCVRRPRPAQQDPDGLLRRSSVDEIQAAAGESNQLTLIVTPRRPAKVLKKTFMEMAFSPPIDIKIRVSNGRTTERAVSTAGLAGPLPARRARCRPGSADSRSRRRPGPRRGRFGHARKPEHAPIPGTLTRVPAGEVD